MTPPAYPLLAGLSFVIASCADPAQPPPLPAEPSRLAPIELREIGRIGCQRCDGPQQLSVRGIATDGRNRVFVLDHFEPFLRVFDAAGEPIAAFGRFGDGPGELRRPGYVFAGPGTDIYVRDRVARRLVRYRIDGSLAEERRMDHFPRQPAYWRAADSFFYSSSHESTAHGQSAIYELLPDGSVVGRLYWPHGDYPLDYQDHAGVYYSLTVGPKGTLAVDESGTKYRVRLYSRDGAPTGEYTLDFERRLKTTEELTQEKRQLEREGMGMVPDSFKLHYYLGALAFDGRGRLWVRAGRSTESVSIFDVFGADGYLGEARTGGGIAERDNTFAVAGSLLAAQFTGDLGEDEIRVFRIRSTDGSPP